MQSWVIIYFVDTVSCVSGNILSLILSYLCFRIRIQKLNLSFNIIFTVLVSRQYKPHREKCFSSWQLLSLGGVFKQWLVSGGQFCTKVKLTLSWLAVVGNSFICCQDHSSASDRLLFIDIFSNIQIQHIYTTF